MKQPIQFDSKAAYRKRRNGTVIVELTLSLTFLTALFLGTWQYGYAFYVYGELEQAVRAGSRYASLQTYNSEPRLPTRSRPLSGTSWFMATRRQQTARRRWLLDLRQTMSR
jgi:Flp pilus assembly protein TadG